MAPAIGKRYFFPCNREDALVLLGSLCVSRNFFLNSAKLALNEDDLAFLDDGITEAEQRLVTGDRPGRFPLLIEVSAEAASRVPRTIAISDVLRLVFRSREEAEDFRFRPVDEIDTEALPADIERELFRSGGEARFTIREPLEDGEEDVAYNADRLAAGILGMVSVARLSKELAPALVDFVAPASSLRDHAETLDLSTACSALGLSDAGPSPTRRQSALLAAFTNDDGSGASSLIQRIAEQLANTGTPSEEEAFQEQRWVSLVHDVIRGRVELTGDQTSDQGSLLLRGALLGAVAEEPESLVAFLRAEKPSGTHVVLLASFFAGLKRGVLQTSWKQKAQNARWLSSLLRDLVVASPRAGAALSSPVAVSETISDGRATIALRVSGHELAQWQLSRLAVEDEIAKRWLADFAAAGYEVLGTGSSPHSWIVALTDGLPIEVSHAQLDEMRYPLLKYRIGDKEKFRKVKEVAQALERTNMFWRRGSIGSTEEFLYCDLPVLPTGESRSLIAAKLTEAISLSVVPKKRTSSPRKSAKRKSTDVPPGEASE